MHGGSSSMSRPDRLKEAERLLNAAIACGYRIRANYDGLTVDRPADMPAKRALSFRLAIAEYKGVDIGTNGIDLILKVPPDLPNETWLELEFGLCLYRNEIIDFILREVEAARRRVQQ